MVPVFTRNEKTVMQYIEKRLYFGKTSHVIEHIGHIHPVFSVHNGAWKSLFRDQPQF